MHEHNHSVCIACLSELILEALTCNRPLMPPGQFIELAFEPGTDCCRCGEDPFMQLNLSTMGAI